MVNYEPREWGEAVGSALIHMIACFENCDIDCCYAFDEMDKACKNPAMILNKLYYNLSKSARQVYYYGKGRKNRYDSIELDEYATRVIKGLIMLNNSHNVRLSLQDSLMLAMAKLEARELNSH